MGQTNNNNRLAYDIPEVNQILKKVTPLEQKVEAQGKYNEDVAKEQNATLAQIKSSTSTALAEQNQNIEKQKTAVDKATRQASSSEVTANSAQAVANKANDAVVQMRKTLDEVERRSREKFDSDHFCGIFDSVSELQASVREPFVGSHAYILETADDDTKDYYLYIFKKNAGWTHAEGDIKFSDTTTNEVKEEGVTQKNLNFTDAVNASVANRNRLLLLQVVNALVGKVNELQKKVAYIEDCELEEIPELALGTFAIDPRDSLQVLGTGTLPFTLSSR